MPNVRALHLRAAEAWDEMARKVDFTTERAAENRAAKDASEGGRGVFDSAGASPAISG